MKATFDHSDQEASNIRTFWFRPKQALNYTAGQYTELTLPHDNPDERGTKHWFTLSSAPGHELVSITTKYAGDERSSTFKKTLFALAPGTEVDLAEAEGDFVMPEDVSIPLVFVAGGIGLTPYHSMLEHLADSGERRNVTFLYSVRVEDEIIFRSTFERSGVQPAIVVSDPTDSWQGERGQLDGPRILELAKPAGNALVYLSGPEPMIEALEKSLLDTGFDKQRLVTDFFPGYTRI